MVGNTNIKTNKTYIVDSMLKIGLFIFLITVLILPFSPVKALILPDIYIGGGYSTATTTTKIKNDVTVLSFDKQASGTIFLVGVRPITFPMPIISNFRIDFQYKKDFSGDARYSSYGGVVYYDILRILPIVNPYIGVGSHKAKANFRGAINHESEDFSVYTGHVGLNVSVPTLPINLFVEYRAAGKNFKDVIKSPSDYNGIIFYDRGLFIGGKISIL